MKIRPMGEITQDLEYLISEMIDGHKLQAGEVDALITAYIRIHYPGAYEQYTDGTMPVQFYGHIDGMIAYAKSLENLRK